MIETVTIVGAGGMGTVVGEAIARGLGKDQVCFLADGLRLARCQAQDIIYNGTPWRFRFCDGSQAQPADLLIFAVKAPALEEAMDLAANSVGPNTIILSLLNGISSEETLALRFGWEKVLYTVTQGMDPVRDGNVIVRRGTGAMFVGLPEEDYFDRGDKLDETVDFLARMGLPVHKEEDILHRMWCKFMLNVGVNQVCMAEELDYGGVQKPGPARDLMIAAMNEVRKISACQGVLLTRGDLDEYLSVLDGLDPASLPSMRQDGLAHRKTEVELFAGTVRSLAARYGMQVPANETLYQKITGMETNW